LERVISGRGLPQTDEETAMTLAHQLAERIHRIDYDQLTPIVLDWVRAAFVDTIGVTLAGIETDTVQIPLRVAGIAAAPGPCLIFGTDRRTCALDATFVNGLASHALDYDDVCGALGGHPSVPLVAPLIALAQWLGASGRAVALAYVVGFETECRIARGVHFHHYDKGWHPTATLGIFGAVAAAARLLALQPEQTARALSLAASFASGLKANFGTMTKPLHVGHCARNGLLATLLAREGFTANTAALEHKQGFLEVFNGAGSYNAARMLGDWGAPFLIETGEPGLKPYPCCGSTHGAIDRALALVRQYHPEADDIASVEVLTHPRRLPHTDNPDPGSGLAAKFSMQYAVARALVDGEVRLDHFEGRAYLDPRVRALMRRLTVRPHPEMVDDSPHQWGAEVIIHLIGGERVSSCINDYLRRGPGGDPIRREELWAKFEDCASRALPRGQIAPLFALLEKIDTLPDVSGLTALLERRAQPLAGAAE
jgi:2-methylcitrate dehydratase PrpD